MSYVERHLFIQDCTQKTLVKRRTTLTTENEKKRKNNSNKFFLKDKTGILTEVCRTFFLTTLGYNKNNNTIIKTSIPGNSVTQQMVVKDGRGKHTTRTRQLDKMLLEQHVKSFHPSVSHYRRVHAPNRLYLPSDLTITLMHNDFLRKNKDTKCCYYTYRAFVTDDMKISFTKLGHEE